MSTMREQGEADARRGKTFPNDLVRAGTARSRSSTRPSCRTDSKRAASRRWPKRRRRSPTCGCAARRSSASTAAYGVALALREDASDAGLDRACATLAATRPTAVNLAWALDADAAARCMPLPAGERAAAAFAEAARIAEEDVALCAAIGDHGLALIAAAAARKPAGAPVNILTHCNAGWLATVDWGTATAPIYKAHDAGIPVHVWVDETRPRNQGASLTAWELGQHGVAHTIIVDNAGGHLMQIGKVDLCIVGTDRTTATGDVCNKIGTYLKALAAQDNGVPFYVAAPSLLDRFRACATGWPKCRSKRARSRRNHPYDRARASDGAPRNRADHAGRQPRAQLRLRHHAGAARDGADHRARRYRCDRKSARRAFPERCR